MCETAQAQTKEDAALPTEPVGQRVGEAAEGKTDKVHGEHESDRRRRRAEQVHLDVPILDEVLLALVDSIGYRRIRSTDLLGRARRENALASHIALELLLEHQVGEGVVVVVVGVSRHACDESNQFLRAAELAHLLIRPMQVILFRILHFYVIHYN